MSAALLLLLAQTAAASAPATPPAERRICRRPPSTGSILRRQVCHTAAEWARIEGDDTQAANNALDQRRNSGHGGRVDP